MRDKARIELMLDALKAKWSTEPDLRLMQLLLNMMPSIKCPEVYYLEDDKLLALLQAPSIH